MFYCRFSVLAERSGPLPDRFPSDTEGTGRHVQQAGMSHQQLEPDRLLGQPPPPPQQLLGLDV